MRSIFALATALALFDGHVAIAQASAPQPSSPGSAPQTTAASNQGTAVQGVTVTAQRPTTTTTIDRKSYAVGSDLQSSTGSVSDVLRNVPAVEVDSDGNISLRGDANVQVLIDGKPSTQLSGANRAAALEEMPADQIERIEVIDNPSAAFKADGSGGVINIVTKKSRKPGRSGSMTASIGDEGRKTVGLYGTQRQGRLSVYAGLNIRQDVRKRIFSDRRTQIDPTTSARSDSTQDGISETRRLSPTLTGGLDFDATKKDRLSANFSYNDRTGTPTSRERDASGAPISAYNRDSLGKEHEVNSDYALKWRHSFAEEGHELEFDVHQSESDEHQRRSYTDVPSGPDTSDQMRLHGDELTREFTADYTRPLPGGAELKAGYDLQRDDDNYDNHDDFVDPQTGVRTVNSALTDHFLYGQWIHALYTTWEHPFDKWTVQAGVRLEQVFIDTNELTTNQTNRISYFRVHPSLHLQYKLSDAQTLRASYSHRVVRPDPEDLNPYPVYQDAFDLRAGNPRLMPQETHSVEGSWQWSHHGASVEATAYWRDTYNSITDVSRYTTIPNQTQLILLTTKENLGRSSTEGLELAASGKIIRSLSFNVSGNLYNSEIDAQNLGFAGTRSAVTYGAKGNLDWKPTAQDTFQISSYTWGKRLTAQGYRLPSGAVNLGYRRKVDDELSLVATVADAFNTQRDRNIIDLPTLHDVYTRRQLGRVFYLGFTRRFGLNKKTDEKFDYSDQGA